MRREAPRIGVEVLLLGLILAVLGGAVGLLVHAHRRVVVKVAPVAPPVAEKTPEGPPEPPAPPPPAPVDLTPERLRPIAAKTAEEKARAEAEARRAARLDDAIDLAEAEARRLLGEAARVRDEAASRDVEALSYEQRRDDLARERDALMEKRDDSRATLERQRLRSRDGVAVLPYKGPNGTWRRPIAIECRGDRATLQPGGPSFSMSELTSFANPRRSPLVFAVAKAMVRARSTRTPDGAASVPYLMFIVRPDGVRPYYAARTLLEPLGINYGYELADADWDIEFPDLDDPSEWSEIPGAKSAAPWPPPGDAPRLRWRPGGQGGTRRQRESAPRRSTIPDGRRAAGLAETSGCPGRRAAPDRRERRAEGGREVTDSIRLQTVRAPRPDRGGARTRRPSPRIPGRRPRDSGRHAFEARRFGHRRLPGYGGVGTPWQRRSWRHAHAEGRTSPLATRSNRVDAHPDVPAHADLDRAADRGRSGRPLGQSGSTGPRAGRSRGHDRHDGHRLGIRIT